MGKTIDLCPSISKNKKAPYHCGKVPSHIHPMYYACLEKKESILIFHFTLPLDYQLNLVTHSKRVFSISSFTSSAG